MNALKNVLLNILVFISNILVKEDRQIDKLLKLDPTDLYLLLPKTKRKIEKDCMAIFDYENKTIKSIVKSVKFKNNLLMKRRVASYIYDEILSLSSDVELFFGSPPIIIPMPMSKKEKKERGFNQCEEIALELKRIAGSNLKIEFGILKKIRNTQRQVKLNRDERLKNLYKSMCVFLKSEATIKTQHPERNEGEYFLKNRVVIVFDDVYTTGATFGEARRALLASGAKKVFGLFLAH